MLLAFAMHPVTALAFDEPAYESETVAATTATTINDLKRQLQLLQQRLATLEQSAATPKALPNPVAKSAPTKYKADLRYRHEAFSIESKPTRQRHRIRARFATTKSIDETLDVTFGLASGSSDPVSTNQTLGKWQLIKKRALGPRLRPVADPDQRP